MEDLVARQDSGTHIVRLHAHAAVRLSEVKGDLFDCYDLPVDLGTRSSRKARSFAKKMKTLASYLTVRINPAFQECKVAVVETLQGLTLEVRLATPTRSPATSTPSTGDRPLFAAPLATLLDVSRDSVIEKDNVVFTHLPDSFHPGSENGSIVKPVAKEPKTPKKGEIISTLFSAYGDIGLTLVFRTPRGTGANVKPLTRITLRFVATAERNTWMSFFMEAYVGLLLDSIRSGVERICPPPAEAAGVVEHPHLHPQHQQGQGAAFPVACEPVAPTREAIDKYIDFFLSSSVRGAADSDEESQGSGADEWADRTRSLEPPNEGLLKVGESGESRPRLRRLTYEQATCSDGPTTALISCLVIRRGKKSQRLRKGEPLEWWLPINTFTVYAEDDQHGASFCVELQALPLCRMTSGAAVTPLPGPIQTAAVGGSGLADMQAAFASHIPEDGDGGGNDGDGDATAYDTGRGLRPHRTLELIADSWATREEWLRWFESVVGRPVLYLNRARQEAESEKVRGSRAGGLLSPLHDDGTW